MKAFLFSLFFLVAASPVLAQAASLAVAPSHIVQGDAVMVEIPGLSDVAQVKTITFSRSSPTPFLHVGKVMFFVPIPLTKKPGVYPLTVVLTNGQTIHQNITVYARTAAQETLGIPATLGGTTVKNTKRIIAALTAENRKLSKIKSAAAALWSEPFSLPLADAVVTDPYGVVRNTSGYSITHMGTDFRAATPTPVLAMNSGIVRVASYNKPYGNTVVIDHGLGLKTMYMHLSQIDVRVEDTVVQKQVIGLTGNTGYAEGAHLHVSVRLGAISVDPMDFLALFQ